MRSLNADRTLTWGIFATVCLVSLGTANVGFAQSTLVCNGPTLGFDAGIPADWSVVNNAAGNPVFWTDLAGSGEGGNYATGNGDCASASSDLQGGGSGLYDTELWSPVIDLTGVGTVTLEYWANYQNFGGADFLDVDASTDGGATWTNVLSWNADHGPFRASPGEQVVLDLTPLSGQPNVILRWHYYDPAGPVTSQDWYAQIDEVSLTCAVGPGIDLQKTVGTDPVACATTEAIVVPYGTEVYYCYEVTNTGTVALDLHDLVDDQFGTIFTGFAYSLAPGASVTTVDAGLTISQVMTATTTNTGTWTAYNPGPTDVATASDSATVTVIGPDCPDGYTPVFLALADFEGAFPPTGWTVANTTTGCSGVPEWTNTDPGGRGNLTGGVGAFAIADSDECGSGSIMNTEMWTPPMDFTSLVNPRVSYWTDYNDISSTSDVGDLDFSTDGGATWTNLISWNEDHRGPLLVQQDFPGDNESNVVVRWNYTNATFDWWWQVDDVFVSACEPPAGTASISLTKTVGTAPGVCATTNAITVDLGTEVYYCYEVSNTGNVALDLHDLVDDQLGTIFTGLNYVLAPGASVNTVDAGLTISAIMTATTTNTGTWTAYVDGGPSAQATASATVTVVSFPDIDVTPANLANTQLVGTVVTQPLTVANVGTATLDWSIDEAAAPAAGDAGHGLPQRQVRKSLPGDPGPVDQLNCADYVDYPGREPEGYLEQCLGGVVPSSGAPVSGFAPTDTGYALDLRSSSFVTFTLNDFPGQTPVGTVTQSVYGMDFDSTLSTLYGLDNAALELGTIDTASGAWTTIGSSIPVGGHTWTGLTVDPTDGTMYASSTDGSTSILYTVDPATGAPTQVGPMGTSLMIDISVGPTGQMYGHDIGTDSIYTIDKATGTATLVGLTGYNANFAQGMDFDNDDGTLYIFLYIGSGANVYGTVDLATGAVTPLAADNPLGEFEGAIAAGGICSNPEDIPWLSVAPDTGTNEPGTNTVVDVTFDATVVPVGLYDATLCVRSNDPDEPLVVVPVQMEVVIPVELMGFSVE